MTPEHHHYEGTNCWHRGSVCVMSRCQWAIDAGFLPLHADCKDPEPEPLSPEWWAAREAEARYAATKEESP